MVRLLIWFAIAVVVYLVYRFVRRLIAEIRRYFPSRPHVRSSSSSQTSKNHIDYSKIQDAEFKDVKGGEDEPS